VHLERKFTNIKPKHTVYSFHYAPTITECLLKKMFLSIFTKPFKNRYTDTETDRQTDRQRTRVGYVVYIIKIQHAAVPITHTVVGVGTKEFQIEAI